MEKIVLAVCITDKVKSEQEIRIWENVEGDI